MITRIREVRRAKGLTLDDVAKRCVPPTTAQTIGRLETGTRTVSISWLNRIAGALGVTAAELVDMPGREHMPVAAYLGAEGAYAPARPAHFAAPLITGGMVGLRIMSSIGDYRTGDEIWCARIPPEKFAGALNRDVLFPRPGGRFLFGRLIGREGDRVQILQFSPGARQQILSDPPWAAVATRLIRAL
ncbi:MAG: helix-turn-helix domain-containing protein [Sphingobium sp.]